MYTKKIVHKILKGAKEFTRRYHFLGNREDVFYEELTERSYLACEYQKKNKISSRGKLAKLFIELCNMMKSCFLALNSVFGMLSCILLHAFLLACWALDVGIELVCSEIGRRIKKRRKRIPDDDVQRAQLDNFDN